MIGELLKSEAPAFGILCGYAGTGKSSMLQMVSEIYGYPVVLTPTGKAAVRVREATGLAASTIHRFMYKVAEDPKTGFVSWVLKSPIEIGRPASGLVIVDEASMLSDTIWRDLWKTCAALDCRVLLVGDLFQLPPVKPENKDFSALTSLTTPYRADLTEVVRQALDNPIIRASMLIRKSSLDALDAVDLLRNIPRVSVVEEFVKLEGDRALIAWRNKTRQRYNHLIREAAGYMDEELHAGEPLLVTFNNYPMDRYNGEVVAFRNWLVPPGDTQPVKDRFADAVGTMSFGVADIEGAEAMLSPQEVFGRVEQLSSKCIQGAARGFARDVLGRNKFNMLPHLNANLGYALTCHKAQGSEWDHVVVLMEPGKGLGDYEGRRWAYTALTRGKKTSSLCFLDE